MKKKILLISLVLVVLMTAVMPATALAKSNKYQPSKPVLEDFSGSGLIYVTYMPQPAIRGKIWRYFDEIAEGFLQYSDWDLMTGAAFWSSHDSYVIVQDDGTANGLMKGEFRLTRPDGSGVLEGFFEGRISGNLFTGFISDSGMWFSTGGSGVFNNVRAWGRWSADLGYDPGIGTLIGPLNWSGKYMQK